MFENDQSKETDEFFKLAESKRKNLISEFWDYLKDNKKWWLIPILIALMALGILVFLSTTTVAPFIYTLF